MYVTKRDRERLAASSDRVLSYELDECQRRLSAPRPIEPNYWAARKRAIEAETRRRSD